MVVEWQKVRVRPELRDLYVLRDREVWTHGLAREPGFLGKETWLGEDGSEVILIIRWREEADWKGMPQERQDALDRRFREAFPENEWELVETRSFQVA